MSELVGAIQKVLSLKDFWRLATRDERAVRVWRFGSFLYALLATWSQQRLYFLPLPHWQGGLRSGPDTTSVAMGSGPCLPS